jgi:electron transport complex protein RnfB
MNTIIIAVIVLFSLAIVFGLILGFSAIKFQVVGNPIVDQIDSLLPQTQCGQCGHPGCRPYAESIANGEAINKCPPGGQATIESLANLLDLEILELDGDHDDNPIKTVAYIREDECIGCTKCIQACPVDAILGAAKQMHTVIVDECTGCDLCVAPCPVDCIDMLPIATTINNWKWQAPKEHNKFQQQLIATDKSQPVEQES